MSIVSQDPKASIDNSAGFTLVEILVTLMASAIFVIAVNTIYTTQVYMNQRGRDLTLANSFVESKVEQLRSAGYLNLADGSTDITSELPSELNDPRSGTLTISSANTGTKQVDISVTFNEQGASRTYTYTTYVGELGVGQF